MPVQPPRPAAQVTPDTPDTQPPIARLTSAPEILISTPEHPSPATAHQDAATKVTHQKRGAGKFTAFKNVYQASQKNAWTRAATKVTVKMATGALTNVIGADVSQAVDGIGGVANVAQSTGIDWGNVAGKAVSSVADVGVDTVMEKAEGGRGGGDGGGHGVAAAGDGGSGGGGGGAGRRGFGGERRGGWKTNLIMKSMGR